MVLTAVTFVLFICSSAISSMSRPPSSPSSTLSSPAAPATAFPLDRGFLLPDGPDAGALSSSSSSSRCLAAFATWDGRLRAGLRDTRAGGSMSPGTAEVEVDWAGGGSG